MISQRKIVNITLFFRMLVVGFIISMPFANAFENNYRPNRDFLKTDPYKKTKARVELSGVKNESDLLVVKNAIDDTLRFIRLFGLSRRLANGQVVLENPRLHPAFLLLTTEQGRQEIDIDPASNRFVQKVFNWNIFSNEKIEVDIILEQASYSFEPGEVPYVRMYRLGFVKNQCDARWCLNSAKRIG